MNFSEKPKPFNSREALLWEGFVSPIYMDSSAHAKTEWLYGNTTYYSVIQEFAAGNLMAGVRSLGLAEDNVGYMLAEGNKALLSDELLEKVEALKASVIAGAIPMVPETNEPVIP